MTLSRNRRARQDFGLSHISDLDFKAEVADTASQALGRAIAVEAGEVEVAEVAVGARVAKQVISCGQDRGRDGDHRFFGSAAGFYSEELGG